MVLEAIYGIQCLSSTNGLDGFIQDSSRLSRITSEFRCMQSVRTGSDEQQ